MAGVLFKSIILLEGKNNIFFESFHFWYWKKKIEFGLRRAKIHRIFCLSVHNRNVSFGQSTQIQIQWTQWNPLWMRIIAWMNWSKKKENYHSHNDWVTVFLWLKNESNGTQKFDLSHSSKFGNICCSDLTSWIWNNIQTKINHE